MRFKVTGSEIVDKKPVEMGKLPFIIMTIIAVGLAAALAVVLQQPDVSTFEIDQDRATLKTEIRATEIESEQYAGGLIKAVCTENWIRLDARQRLGNPAT